MAAPLSGSSLLLAGSLCFLPFIVPYHQLPILSFHAEWLAGALGVLALALALADRGSELVAVPVAARWLIGFALLLALRGVGGDPAYPQIPLWAVVYAIYAVLMLWLGAQLAAAHGVERTVLVLASFILAGALANAAVGLIQFYGRPVWLEDLVAGLRVTRAYGNIAQPNLYANYLALGQAALLLLWARGQIGTLPTLAAAALLVWGGALAVSRSTVLYPLWFAVAAALAARGQHGSPLRRLAAAAFALTVVTLSAYFAVPWLNDRFGLGPALDDPVRRLLSDVRPQAWAIALRLFSDAPFLGIGSGEFAGAAFMSGLSPEMADIGIWTSPHNIVLHLLAETGVTGAVLVSGALATWWWQAFRRYFTVPVPILWWVVAAAGVELILSMVDYPMWSAHFLGLTALVMGTLTSAPATSAPAHGPHTALPRRLLGAVTCALLAAVLAVSLRDYWRLELTHVTGAGRTLAGFGAVKEVQTLTGLGRGLLAPVAEYWLCLGVPLDGHDLEAKLQLSERVMRYRPSDEIVARRAIFLALAGRSNEAGGLIDRLSANPPERKQIVMRLLRQAEPADPAAMRALSSRLGTRDR